MNPKDLLDTMLGYLGFICQIEETEGVSGPVLMIYSNESERIIGPHGERLQDLQFLLNRFLQTENADSPRVTLDCEHYRAMREDELISRVQARAERVRRTGKAVTLEPMNSYDRRTVHNAFKDDPDVETVSPPGDRRMKSITLRRRGMRAGNPRTGETI